MVSELPQVFPLQSWQLLSIGSANHQVTKKCPEKHGTAMCVCNIYIYIYTYYNDNNNNMHILYLYIRILFILQLCTTASFNEILRSKLSGRSSASSTSAGSQGCHGMSQGTRSVQWLPGLVNIQKTIENGTRRSKKSTGCQTLSCIIFLYQAYACKKNLKRLKI